MYDVAKRITILCTEHNLSISELSKRSKVPPSTINGILDGSDQDPGIVTIKKLCDGMEITLQEFFV